MTKEKGSPPLPRSLWLLSESRRSVHVTAASIPLAFIAVALMTSYSPELRRLLQTDSAARSLLGVVVVWALFAALHTALTWWTFRGLRGEELARAVAADPAWRHRHRQGRSRLARMVFGFGPSSWAASVSVLALIAVVTMVLYPHLRAIPIALLVAIAMVALSWLNVAVMYAVHYARVDLDGDAAERRASLVFPGEQPDRMLDYLYFAVGVQATFGSTDVEVRTSAARELVLGHSLMAFTYNTVIVGMVISLLLSLS